MEKLKKSYVRYDWKSYKNLVSYNHFHNILRLFDVLPNLVSTQMKQCAIITYKHGIYELPNELPND